MGTMCVLSVFFVRDSVALNPVWKIATFSVRQHKSFFACVAITKEYKATCLTVYYIVYAFHAADGIA